MSAFDPSKLPQAGRLLALDVGDRRIGLAVSMPPGSLILPAGYIQRRNRRADVAAILDAASSRDVVAIIVGIPYDAQGRAGEQARKIQSLVRALERAADIPVLTVDESYTSQAAETELRQADPSAPPSRGDIDSGAAVAILRRFIAQAIPAT
ncbi:MAG: Holliday junction resolvase RuvX [Chloroflexota bacterium]|nr:Holliday junction resolvase RuvX [Chloroflexota bacterium]MDE2683551.1 Holliday junction resolvase RuvX [Chloroflexota bacterium]